MALENEGMVMPVAPMVGGGFGGNNSGFGDGNGLWWLILLFVILGGWNNNGNNGNNGGGTPYVIGNTVQDGFNQAALTSGINDIQSAICNGFAGVNANVSSGFAQAEVADNSRQIANMQQSFANQMAMNSGFNALQSQLAQCCCDNRLATCQLGNTVQNEASATRFADANNTRDIIESTNRNGQLILDKLCQLELDGKNDRIADLERQLTMANLRESQTAQTSQIQLGQVAEVDALYQRLRECPVPSMPVYGSQPIFTCPNNNNGCGCGCGSF